MSKGYPDYFGYSMFPSYGQIYKSESLISTSPNNTDYLIYNAIFKGVIQGGFISLSGMNIPPAANIQINCDGETILITTISTLYAYNLSQGNMLPIKLNLYNRESEHFVLEICRGLPIQSNFTIELQNRTGGVISIAGKLFYSVIQT